MIVKALTRASATLSGVLPTWPLLRVGASALSFFLLLPMAGAQLRFRTDSMHAALWRKVYTQLPPAWKAREFVYVREITDARMDRFIEQFEGANDRTDSIIDGCYQKHADPEEMAGSITLRESLHGESAALVFIHEYGHYVWGNVLNSVERSRYRRLWRDQKRANRLVTDYAGESDEEGFAEAFAYFIRRPATLRRQDPRSSRFLETVQHDATPPDADVN